MIDKNVDIFWSDCIMKTWVLNIEQEKGLISTGTF